MFYSSTVRGELHPEVVYRSGCACPPQTGLVFLLSFLAFLGESSSSFICRLPEEIGYCRGSIPRFYFNIKSGQCENFIYGGCGGNANNFLTQDECLSKCGGKVKINHPQVVKLGRQRHGREADSALPQALYFSILGESSSSFICRLPEEIGYCRGSIPRFYFNIKSGQCENFIYGGCGGNANNFLTQDECLSKCGGKVKINHPQVVLLMAKGLYHGLHCIMLRILMNSSDWLKSASFWGMEADATSCDICHAPNWDESIAKRLYTNTEGFPLMAMLSRVMGKAL
uniref:BPTI/Kunitz inhibitor domain-containing protein n=1 Tax=Anolis carolinensis TaxID=28377 RepID=H9G3A2_ANOCA